VRDLVIERGLQRSVIVSAFEWDELESLPPEIPIGLLSSKLTGLISSARELSAAAIHPRRDLVTEAMIAAAREASLRVHVWTVNEPEEIQYFRKLGVDGVFTDFPESCRGGL
jgi:glycerophosphoryl diester phosphodiesterase